MADELQAQPLVLSLEKTISIAADSSLEAFRSRNLYLAGYWEFRGYKAGRLPSLTLDITPAEYYRNITKRYDSELDIDEYRSQQSFYAGGNLRINQNIDWLGGNLYVNSNLGYMRYFGNRTYNQFTSVPIQIGYTQELVGYNPFRWEKRIEPLKYERAKRELLYNLEVVSEQVTSYFFDLATAQVEYDMAQENVASSDTLYRTGQERLKIAAISQADLLTLRLDAINARNALKNADIALKRAMSSLASYLNLDKGIEIRLLLPSRPGELEVPAEQALTMARENNPELMGARQSVLEAEREVDRAHKESLFNASVNASIGFNQVSSSLKGAYKDPLQQDLVSISVSIPLIDWGVRKGKYNVAKSDLNIARIAARQKEMTVEEDIIMTVGDFNVQQDLIKSAEEALDIAIMAYHETRQRFMIGKADLNSLTLSLNRQQEAKRNYISALRNYWLSYYKIRKLTLHDFETGIPLSDKFDYEHGF